MSSCQICLEPFDHSVHKPYSLSSCPHTYCSSCLDKLTNNKCPTCAKQIAGKNLNIALLELTPESEYDKLKKLTLKSLIDMNEINQELNITEKLHIQATKLASVKQVIKEETKRLMNILKNNEKMLTNECDSIFDKMNANLNNYGNIVLLRNFKKRLENNELNENQLKNFYEHQMPILKKQLNELTNQMKQLQDNYELIANNTLAIGEIATSHKCLIKGNQLFEYQQFQEAIQFFNKGIELNGTNSLVYYKKGLCFESLNNYKEAIQCFDKSLSLDANYSDCYNSKGTVLYNTSKYEEAIECFTKSIQLNPKNAITHNNKGVALKILNKNEEAIECYDKAIQHNPQYSEAYANKGFALLHLNKYQEALLYFNKAIELDPSNSFAISNKQSCICKIQKD